MQVFPIRDGCYSALGSAVQVSSPDSALPMSQWPFSFSFSRNVTLWSIAVTPSNGPSSAWTFSKCSVVSRPEHPSSVTLTQSPRRIVLAAHSFVKSTSFIHGTCGNSRNRVPYAEDGKFELKAMPTRQKQQGDHFQLSPLLFSPAPFLEATDLTSYPFTPAQLQSVFAMPRGFPQSNIYDIDNALPPDVDSANPQELAALDSSTAVNDTPIPYMTAEGPSSYYAPWSSANEMPSAPAEPPLPQHYTAQHTTMASPTHGSVRWVPSVISSDSGPVAGPSSYSMQAYDAGPKSAAYFYSYPVSSSTTQPPPQSTSTGVSPYSEVQKTTPPATPGASSSQVYKTSPPENSPLLLSFSPKANQDKPLYSHRMQAQFFKSALSLPMSYSAGPFVPQQMYKPHTNSDIRRYVEEVQLDAPIYFWMENPSECGIPLSDALQSRVKRLQGRDESVFEGRGPSISVRLQWPGYRQWSRQIPTKDFRSPPGPITKAKLTKNVAKCVQRFIDARKNQSLEDDVDAKWKVGYRPGEIKLDDLVLVSMHHVSMGSWQPQLRLRRPFSS